jgi:hypothetical protein
MSFVRSKCSVALKASSRSSGVRRVIASRGFADFGKQLVDPCGGWTFGSLFTPLKTAPTPIAEVKDVSVHGLDIITITEALKNMSVPASSDAKVTLGRWAKTDEKVSLTKKYT